MPCSIGTYSDTVNATTCTACSPGYTTSQLGSNKPSQCTGIVCLYFLKLKKNEINDEIDISVLFKIHCLGIIECLYFLHVGY